ncbi:hypothetical protein U9M48_026192, partial [Paspalum notatum var. saurae]
MTASGVIKGPVLQLASSRIKKFKDVLAKHIPHRSNLGPTRFIKELKLLALAVNKDLQFIHTKKNELRTDSSVDAAADVISLLQILFFYHREELDLESRELWMECDDNACLEAKAVNLQRILAKEPINCLRLVTIPLAMPSQAIT